MQIRTTVIAVVLSTLLLIGGILGQAEVPVPCPHATAVMERVGQVYDQITSFYAKALSFMIIGEEKQPTTILQMWFDYPRIRMDIVIDKDDIQVLMTMISGLQTQFIYMYSDGQWSKMRDDPPPLNITNVFHLEADTHYTAIHEEILAERAVWVIESVVLIADELQRTTWWIDQQTYFIVQMTIINEIPAVGKQTITIEWKEFMPNITIPDEKFIVPEDIPLADPFTPPERLDAPFPAPEFRAIDIAGEEIVLVDLRGKVILINFWTSWCPPCIDKLPLIQRLYEEYAAKGLVIIGINLDRTKQEMNQAIDRFNITFRQIFEQADKIAELFNVVGVPATFLIDRQGVVRYLHLRHEDQLRAAIKRLLVEQ